ncbi:2-Hydroxyacid oxidase 2-like [Saccoglossus kowalevskii]
MTVEDALIAVEHKVDAIMVSNHGGRQLDGVPATIDELTEISRDVADEIEVYMDGGVRTGTDIFKALALGGKAVFIGRPILYGLLKH